MRTAGVHVMMGVVQRRRAIELRRTALETIGVALGIPMTLALFDLCCRAASFDGLFLVWLPTSTLAIIGGIAAVGYAAAFMGISACAELTDR
jgi:hypothetical protein